MGGLRLWETAIWLLLGRVYQVCEFDRILNEEHRNVVADDVLIALLAIYLYCEAADVTSKVSGSYIARDGGEANEGRGVLTEALEDVCCGKGRERRIRDLKKSVCAEAACVDHTLRNALAFSPACRAGFNDPSLALATLTLSAMNFSCLHWMCARNQKLRRHICPVIQPICGRRSGEQEGSCNTAFDL
jgi:hypothetical protein